MLTELKVKNVALIREAEISFGKGLNILTGETGAGKSILIDSIQLALGARADKGLIRESADHAYVELTFKVDDEMIDAKLRQLEILPEDRQVILSRRLEASRNTCRINGEVVSGKLLRQASALLIDIHGQQEHTTLLQEKKHLEILDRSAGSKLEKQKEKIAELYGTYRELSEKLEEAKSRQGQKERDMDLCRYELGEIEEADLRAGEDDELETEFKRLSNASKIAESLEIAKDALDGFSGESALSLVGTALGSLKDAQRFDDTLGDLSGQLLQTEDMLREIARELMHRTEGMSFDEERMAQVSARLDVINRLKTKYGNSIEEILSYGEEKRKLLEELEDFDAYLAELENRLAKVGAELDEYCNKAHDIREKQAKIFSKDITKALSDLGFAHVEFETRVTQDAQYLGPDGNDHACFFVCLNAGEKLRPLSDVASGGELSRIMLAIKSVMADKDEIPTLIFDEIDAGISGQTAWKVSEKMAVIGRAHQLLCITHLPQIAAMADQHFMIEKNAGKNETRTQIKVLGREGMIGEVARLLGSDEITKTALENAEELKAKADEVKALAGK